MKESSGISKIMSLQILHAGMHTQANRSLTVHMLGLHIMT